MKKTSVSFGIPAYNEEKNIAFLIKDVLSQKNNNWILKEIIVVDDASSDRTIAKVKSFAKAPVKIIVHKKRSGKTAAFKDMIEAFKGDILIQFDADERLGGKTVVEKVVRGFQQFPNAMLVSGNK